MQPSEDYIYGCLNNRNNINDRSIYLNSDDVSTLECLMEFKRFVLSKRNLYFQTKYRWERILQESYAPWVICWVTSEWVAKSDKILNFQGSAAGKIFPGRILRFKILPEESTRQNLELAIFEHLKNGKIAHF